MLKKVLGLFKKQTFSSADFWEERYKIGENSGSGSYNYLADFKAETINELIKEYNISGIIEFGCGDGNQLSLLKPEKYIGLDVSPMILKL
jgi:hypothetical protein